MIHEYIALTCWDGGEEGRGRIQYLLKALPSCILGHRMCDRQSLNYTTTLGMSGLKLRQGAFFITKGILGMWPFAEQKGRSNRVAVMGKLGLLPHGVPEQIQWAKDRRIHTANSPAEQWLSGLL